MSAHVFNEDMLEELLSSVDMKHPLQHGKAAPQPQRSRSFDWEPCTYCLQNEKGGEWPVLPNVMAHLSVQMERVPIASPHGLQAWAWHKNCVLPSLHVSVTSKGSLVGAAVLLSAATVDVLEHIAVERGLEGDSLRLLVNGSCSFSSLAFKTTSYNLKGKPLHLLAVLLLRPSPGESLHIASMLLSPPIRVDARKRLAKEKLSGSGGMPSLGPSSELSAPEMLLPFSPDLLERKMEKVGRGSGASAGGGSRQLIDNSMEGLRAYLSALNIRNKSKHPLFFVLRFSACIGLLYNKTAALNPAEDDAAFFRMMSEIGRQHDRPPTSIDSELPAFVVAVKGNQGEAGVHVCERIDCPVQLSTEIRLPHCASLPAAYQMLSDHEVRQLRHTYCRLYCSHSTAKVPLAHDKAPAPATTQLRRPQLCRPCGVTELHATRDESNTKGMRQTQKHAGLLLGSAQQLASSAENADSCPAKEWELVLAMLGEALAQHCRTRSCSEILAFMQDAEASAPKRLLISHSSVQQSSPHGGSPPPSQSPAMAIPAAPSAQHPRLMMAGHMSGHMSGQMSGQMSGHHISMQQGSAMQQMVAMQDGVSMQQELSYAHGLSMAHELSMQQARTTVQQDISVPPGVSMPPGIIIQQAAQHGGWVMHPHPPRHVQAHADAHNARMLHAPASVEVPLSVEVAIEPPAMDSEAPYYFG